ncbi:ribosomal protein L21-like protein [Lasiosphaeria miniovina]|uniref:Large ribosomal subunit protein bL21m n=1 Tax=Lasiosphaeria miniovina TaxID=1954250 RepID=A0AA40DJG2_9PEZI|nr:ribosomal protein L21-like protein [Lasiosphaeria miniovina]KAK0703626.1 ribosomal protein L21-like protein [Lasiosphaeria miniovina]
MSRALLRSALELRTPITRLPPPFLLPIPIRPRANALTAAPAAARFFNQTTQIVDPPIPSSILADAGRTPTQSPTAPAPTAAPVAGISKISAALSTQIPQPPPPARTSTEPLSESVRTLLPLLAAQPGHYATAHIHGRPYLVTAGDLVRLPFKMPGVAPGDMLRLTRATAIGSRDFTLTGAPWVDERVFECRAVVLGTESEPMRVLIKKKRRQRRAKRVESKHRFTVLRISELRICDELVAA